MTSTMPRLVLGMLGVALGLVGGGVTSTNTLVGAGAAMVVAALVFIRHASFRPTFWLYLLIVTACFTAAMPRGALVPILTPVDLTLLLAVAHMLVYLAFTDVRARIPKRLFIAAAVLAIGTALGPYYVYLVRGVEVGVDGLVNLLSPLKYLLVFWLFACIPASFKERQKVVRVMIACAAAVALIGLLQAAGVQPVVSWLRAWYPSGHAEVSAEVGRVTSVLGAWNALGNFLVVALLLVVVSLAEERRRRARSFLILSALALVACLLATNLYSGILGAALGIVFIKVIDPRGAWIVWLTAAAAAVAGIFLAPDLVERWAEQFTRESWIPQTLRYRAMIWSQYFWPGITAQPWWGVAPTYDHLPFPFPESQYVHLLYRTGLWSLVAHIMWLVVTIAWLARRVKGRLRLRHGLDRGVALAAATTLGAYTLIGLINPVFTYTTSMIFLWAMIGLSANAFTGGDDAR